MEEWVYNHWLGYLLLEQEKTIKQGINNGTKFSIKYFSKR
jgi:hypothetical protein